MKMAGDKTRLSFAPIMSNQKDFSIESSKEQFIRSILALVTTPRGTHMYDPEYGVDIRKSVFSFDNANLPISIQYDIKNAIEKYLPEISQLTDVVVDYVPSTVNKYQKILSVNITLLNIFELKLYVNKDYGNIYIGDL